MKKPDYVNEWLRLLLESMRERQGFVTSAAKEGHLNKKVFNPNVSDVADNIHSADHLVRLILLWARDSILMVSEEEFQAKWIRLGELALQLMSGEGGEVFCQSYDRRLKSSQDDAAKEK